MPGSGILSRLSLPAAQLAMLGLAGWAAWSGPGQAPVFTGSEGDVSGTPFPARFDRKTHHVAASWHLFNRLEQGGDAATATALADHARAALRAGPASGYAWLALAWGDHLAGRDAPARQALATSWRVAPHVRNLAFARVLLASRWWPELDAEARAYLLAEMDRARSYEPEAFAARLAEDPRFASLWRLARARGLTPAYSR